MTMGTHVGVHSCECVRLLQLGGGANGLLKSVNQERGHAEEPHWKFTGSLKP